MNKSIFLMLPLVLGVTLAAGPGRGQGDDSRDQAVKHYQEGQRALSTERFLEAEREFKAAIGFDPLFVGAHYGLGQAYMALNRFRGAIQAYTAAEESFHGQQSLRLSNSMEYQKRLDDQIYALEADVQNAQRLASGSNAQAIESAIGRKEAQIHSLQRLRNRDTNEVLPTPHWLSLALGSAYFRNQNLVKAEQAYRAAVEVKPDLGEAHLNLSVVYMLTDRLDEAEQEVALAEKGGIRVPRGLKDDIKKRRAGGP